MPCVWGRSRRDNRAFAVMESLAPRAGILRPATASCTLGLIADMLMGVAPERRGSVRMIGLHRCGRPVSTGPTTCDYEGSCTRTGAVEPRTTSSGS
jgi:hypothetical protein